MTSVFLLSHLVTCLAGKSGHPNRTFPNRYVAILSIIAFFCGLIYLIYHCIKCCRKPINRPQAVGTHEEFSTSTVEIPISQQYDRQIIMLPSVGAAYSHTQEFDDQTV